MRVESLGNLELPALPPSMRWATFWVYFALPYGALLSVLAALPSLLENSASGAAVAAVFGSHAILQIWVAVRMAAGDASAWRWNWLVLGASCAETIVAVQSADSASATIAIIVVIPILVAWLGLNYRYWNKRRLYFREWNQGPLPIPRHWIGAPIAAWVLFALMIIVSLGALVVNPDLVDPARSNMGITANGRPDPSDSSDSNAQARADAAADALWAEAVNRLVSDPRNTALLSQDVHMRGLGLTVEIVARENPNANYDWILTEALRRYKSGISAN